MAIETIDSFISRRGPELVKKKPYRDLETIRFLERFATQEQESLSLSLGEEVVVPTPPQELLSVMFRAKEIRFTQAEAHFIPSLSLEKASDLPDWTVKLEEWYWEQVRLGAIPNDSPTLVGRWVIIDGSQKPNFDNGKQAYIEDPIASFLADLRSKGKIKGANWCRDLPRGSRFGLTYLDIETHVFPKLSNLLDVKPVQVRLPKAIEFNFFGNLYHPEWGETSTSDWFSDPFDSFDGRRFHLVGGRAEKGGLSAVGHHRIDSPSEYIGFRPMIVFPIAA